MKPNFKITIFFCNEAVYKKPKTENTKKSRNT